MVGLVLVHVSRFTKSYNKYFFKKMNWMSSGVFVLACVVSLIAIWLALKPKKKSRMDTSSTKSVEIVQWSLEEKRSPLPIPVFIRPVPNDSMLNVTFIIFDIFSS
jgi:uncharacterized membrane protein